VGPFLNKQRLQYCILALDLLWAILAMVAAYLLRYGFAEYDPQHGFLTYATALLATMLLWIVIFAAAKMDGFRHGWHLPAVSSQLFLAVCLLMVVLFAAGYLLRIFLSRLTFTYFGVLLFLGFLGIRYFVHFILSSRLLRRAARRIVIVGTGPVAREMAAKIERHPEMLCKVVGFLSSADSSFDILPSALPNKASKVRALEVVDLLRKQQVDEVIITVSQPGSPELMNLAARCRQDGIMVSVVPHPYELYLSKPQLVDIGGLPVLQLREGLANFANSGLKRTFDFVFSLFFFGFSVPVVIAGVIMLLGRRGGPFSRELRCGQNAMPFSMWRLNSDRECKDLPRRELILQQLSITELPQLWNVLRGEMSLVGPRPESLDRVKHYSDWQLQRLKVKPGITGLAQVHGLREQNSSEEKARFDLQYMMRSSFFLDISLLLQTVWTLVGRTAQLYKLTYSGTAREVPGNADLLEGSISNAHSTQSSAD